MTRNKAASIVGVRPNFVKLAALNALLEKNFEHFVIHTGQHYDYEMSSAFFDCLDLPEPLYNLDVGSGSQGYQLGVMILRTEQVLLKEKPDLVIVYGDANSTLAGSLSAAKLNVKIAHVEAGYRSFDKTMPEEINRVLTDHISDFLFAPTRTSMENLKSEGISGHAYLTGDVMVDVLFDYVPLAEEKSDVLEKLKVEPKNYILATLHRESFLHSFERAANVIEALASLKDTICVFPMHPGTKKSLAEYGLLERLTKKGNMMITPPMNYLDFVKLEKHAWKILTDSGGVQKEAYVLGVPCITLRDTTECNETIEEGWNTLVGYDSRKIIKAVHRFNPKRKDERRAFGDGESAKRIVDILKSESER